ncbi:1404_t:CDS:2, partial [Dentiscutata erythropus]
MKIIWKKVVSHIGEIYNEKADSLAKRGVKNKQEKIQENYESIAKIRYLPRWQKLLIEIKLRKFIRNLTTTIYETELPTLDHCIRHNIYNKRSAQCFCKEYEEIWNKIENEIIEKLISETIATKKSINTNSLHKELKKIVFEAKEVDEKN